jgi:hypothetical protein
MRESCRMRFRKSEKEIITYKRASQCRRPTAELSRKLEESRCWDTCSKLLCSRNEGPQSDRRTTKIRRSLVHKEYLRKIRGAVVVAGRKRR